MNAFGIVDLAAAGAAFAGGFALGTFFGRTLVRDLTALVRAIEVRVSAVETSLRSAGARSADKHAAAVEHHAAAIEKLAHAIGDSHGTAHTAVAPVAPAPEHPAVAAR